MVKIFFAIPVFIITVLTANTVAAQVTVIVSLPNPIGAGTVLELIQEITSALRQIGLPIVSVVVLYAAFQILFAAGDEQKFATGKKTILYAVIAYVIILVAESISSLILDVLR